MTAPRRSPPVLQLRGVVKSFGGNHVLRGVDLDVSRHEVVALIGASGSGKSTLLKVSNLLERIGLAQQAKAYPDRLSGGQQQRVAIARAIATDPELLLLDEITSALDPQLVGEVLDLVAELKGAGSTILMATHEIGFARRVADRVVYLHAGQVCEQGPPAQVLDAPQRPETQDFLRRVLR